MQAKHFAAALLPVVASYFASIASGACSDEGAQGAFSGMEAGQDTNRDSDTQLHCVAPQRCVDDIFCVVNYADSYGDPYDCTEGETCCFGLPDTDPEDWMGIGSKLPN